MSEAIFPSAVPLAALQPAPWNPRSIKSERFENLCASFQADPAFLWRRPARRSAAMWPTRSTRRGRRQLLPNSAARTRDWGPRRRSGTQTASDRAPGECRLVRLSSRVDPLP